MKIINDREQISQWMDRINIRDYFSTPDLKFCIYHYEKGEFITAPAKKMKELLFVAEGTVRIYGVRHNGTVSPITQQNAPMLLGDIEFVTGGTPLFFTEAMTDVICAALPMSEYEERLNSDLRFLHILLASYVEKLQNFTCVDALAETVEDRVLLYISTFCPDHELKGTEAASLQIRCSRRQLQRVLRKLCTEGKLKKTGKGRYKLIRQ